MWKMSILITEKNKVLYIVDKEVQYRCAKSSKMYTTYWEEDSFSTTKKSKVLYIIDSKMYVT